MNFVCVIIMAICCFCEVQLVPVECQGALGMENGAISDGQISASSQWDINYAAIHGRLNFKAVPGKVGSWSARSNDVNQWFQIDLGNQTIVTGVATQGRNARNQWVTKYQLQYSDNGVNFQYYTEQGQMEFVGNTDQNTVVHHVLTIRTRYIRFRPTAWYNNISMRVEVYGCKEYLQFVLRLIVRSFVFTLDYANITNPVHNSLKTRATNQLKGILRGSPGFILAEFQRFGPHSLPSQTKSSLMVEMIIAHQENYTSNLVQTLKEKYVNPNLMFDPGYFEMQHAFNTTCPPPVVNINLNKTLNQAKLIFTTDQEFFQAQVIHSSCSRSLRSEMSWEVARANVNSGFFRTFVSRPLLVRKQNIRLYQWILKDFYLYISFVLRDPLDHRVVAYDYGYVLLRRPPVANISGVKRAVKGQGSVILDAFDAVYSRDCIPNFNYSWYCRRKEERFPSNDSHFVDVPNGKSNISSGCYGYGPGRLSGKEMRLKVDVDKMAAGQTYVFRVIVKLHPNTSTTDVHDLTVFVPTTNFTVRCTYNCRPKATISRRTVFETQCSGALCQMFTRYQWSLHKARRTNPGAWIMVKKLRAKALTKLDGPIFELAGKINELEHALEPNTIYKVEVVAFIGEEQAKEDQIIFRTNSPPVTYGNGGCSAHPSDGFALQTSFLVKCSQWNDTDLPLFYTFSYFSTKGKVIIKSGSTLPSMTTILPQGHPSRDYNITVQVGIADALGASSSDMLFVTVRPSEMLKDIIDGPNSTLDKSLSSGDVGQAVGTAALVLSSLENVKMKDQDKNKVKDALLRKLGDIQVNNIQEVEQLSSFVTQATNEREDMPASSLDHTIQLLGSMTDYLWTHVDNGSRYDRDVVQSAGKSVFHGFSNVMSVATSIKGADNDVSRFKKPKDITENTLALIDKLGTTLLSTKVVGEKPSIFNSDTISMMLDRQKPSEIGNKTLLDKEQLGGVLLPSAETLFGNKTTLLDYVDAQMLSLKQNPYTWDDSSQNISSPVIKFELKTGKGSLMNISDLKEPFELLLTITKQKEGGKNDSKDHLFVKPGNALRYHKVYIDSNDKKVFVKLQPQNNTVLEVFVSSGVRPTERNYNFSKRVPDFSSCTFSNDKLGYVNCTMDPFVLSFSSASTGEIGPHFIGIRLANKENVKAHARKARSCIGSTGRQKRSCITVKDPPTTPPPTSIVMPKYNKSADVNYTMLVTLQSCVYWSERRQAWSTDGCKLGPRTTTERLHCLCSHLSAFGGNIFVAPNPIDFDKVFKEFTKLGETKNFVVLSTVCFIIGMYFVGLAFAHRADRKDKPKVVANVLLNVSTESKGYKYNISIQTGMWKGFGTTARVGMKIEGKDGTSGALPLTDLSISRRFFSRASVNNFTLAVTESLGNLKGVSVWHDNSGAHPSWYLQHIVITDVQTQEQWYFFANQWLALDKGAGVTQLYIKVAEGKELTAFKPLFISRATRSLGEGHLWISVFTRPPHSPFTRCQRLSCCLSFLFTAMVTNAMFYQFDKTLTDTFKFGPLTMSWTQIKVGIQSSVIAIPINVLVVLIFRNIKHAPSSNVYVVDSESDTGKTSGCLPRFFLYIAWTLCFLVSSTGAFFTILYSMQWGANQSNQWLTSILVSLVQDVLISQPIKVIAFATLLSLFIRKPPQIDPVIGPSFIKHEQGNRIKCKPVKGQQLKSEKVQSIKRRKALEATKEILTFLIFALLLMVICYGNQDSARYHITKATKDISAGFENIADTPSFWEWIEEVLIPGLYDVTWYDGQPFKYKEGYISNHEEFMLGMPRLRQLRMKPTKHQCPSDLFHSHFTETFNTCRPTYSSSDEDRTAFNLPGWIPLISYNKSHDPYELCPQPWRYQSKEDIESLSHRGVQRMRTYDGGGYVALLGYNKKSALDAVRDLKGHEWIDQSTAVVFIEFTLINPATSLFSITRQVYERLPTGEAGTVSDVRTLSLYPSPNANFQSFYEVCQLVFLVVIVVCFVAEMVKFIRQKSYFHQMWNWVELLLLLVTVVAVAMSFLKAKYTSLYVKKVQENPYETFSPDYIVRWSEQETAWLAAAIFILTLKLLRLIRFNQHICQMQGTMKRAARPLISFVFIFGIGMMAFTYFGCIAFGGHTHIFSSLFNSFKTNLLMSIGKQINYVEIYFINSQIQPIFFFFYFLFIICIMMNIFVAAIVDSYSEIREDHGEAFDDAELGVFIHANFTKKVKQFPGKLVFGVKEIFNLRCTDFELGKKSFKRGQKRKKEPFSRNDNSTHMSDVDNSCGLGHESHQLIPWREDDDSLEIFHEGRKKCCTKARIIDVIDDAIDDHYLHEIRKQLIGALGELSRYYVSTGRDSRAASVLYQE